jgi:hypothetical protein
VRLDYPGGYLQQRFSYASLIKPTAHLGIDAALSKGFQGDVREFFLSYGAINEARIKNVMNMVKVFDVSTMAYYRFQPATGVLNDWMRTQQAKHVIALKPRLTAEKSDDSLVLYVEPELGIASGTSFFCNTLQHRFANVAYFNGFKSGRVPVMNSVFE